MKRIISLFLTTVLLIAVFAVAPAAAEPEAEDIVILYTNDIHCGIDTDIGCDGLKLYLREMKAQYKNVLTVDVGDAIQGMPVGTLSKGKDVITVMNEVGYDAAAVGNHEFDYSVPELMERASELSCGYLCCNFFDKRTGECVFKPYDIFEVAGKKIAFIGVTTPETFLTSTPTYFQDEDGNYIYSFCEKNDDLYKVVQNNIDSAAADGADYVIILGHLGETDSGNGWTSMDVAAHTSGADVILDGHSHTVTPHMVVKNKEGKDVTITQTGTKLQYIGKLTITAAGEITTELIETVPAPSDEMQFDPDSWKEVREGRYGDTATADLIAEINSNDAELLNTKIAQTAFPLCNADPATSLRMIRSHETNLGDLFADAYREFFNTDAAILNGGGLRTTIPAGDITFNSILSVNPFQNQSSAAKVTGQQILDYLEYGAKDYPTEQGLFAQVSGITYTIDSGIESSVEIDEHSNFVGVDGQRRVKDVKIGGEEIDPDKTYTLASINYLLEEGGDGNIFSGKCDIYLKDKAIDMDLIAQYLTDQLNGTIPDEYANPYGQGRISVINSQALLGDADTDGDVTILDATAIQRMLAAFAMLNFDENAADVDRDGEVAIVDATYIQRYLADLSCPEGIGKTV